MTRKDALKPVLEPKFPPSADLMKVVSDAIKNFHGQGPELESAIGMLFMGYAFGWRVLFLFHSISTVRKYERTLGIVAKDVFPERTELSRRSVAFTMVEGVSNFWKTVKGESGHEREGARDKTIVTSVT